MSTSWQPSASIDNLKVRAQILWNIRKFFHNRNVLEVQTPLLGRTTVTDRYIASYEIPGEGYLQTSPEYLLKRLLAAGMPSCYQLASVFRDDESGRWHNPEFTMLEWYRIGFSATDLRREVAELVDCILGKADYVTWPFDTLMEQQLSIDFTRLNSQKLQSILTKLGYHGTLKTHEVNDFLYSQATQRPLPPRLFICDFPKESAALAKTKMVNGKEVAERFELWVNQLEIANGYDELVDAAELSRRMDRDNQLRDDDGLPIIAKDAKLLAAMEHGLPTCAGVALGFDRLCALKVNANSLDEVLSFSNDRV